MEISICSYSFHGLLEAGKQDIFRFITDCKDLGCAYLDPWNAHLPTIGVGDAAITPDSLSLAGGGPGRGTDSRLSPAEKEYLSGIRAAADQAGIPFGTIAVDGANIYDPSADVRKANRLRAYRWIEVASLLGARQIRIDAGGPEEMPDDVFAIICEGYRDVIDRGKAVGVEIVVENHWGSTLIPDNVVKLLENIDGLGYLLDTHNWKPELKNEGRRKCAKYATATHIKTLDWDADGNEAGEEVESAIRILREAGYNGCWGIESCPKDGDEYGGARKTIALMKRVLEA